ncbi:hypothetical protein [Streptomyces chrestomyceticus]|uniref:hypothetical protein n=1 Tax=Streptomyces chrestomyceticus TaxID=68185 RepID=UPI0037BC027D
MPHQFVADVGLGEHTDFVVGILDQATQALRTRLDPDTVVRKRRSVGAGTGRGTWVRVERRPMRRIDGQSWNGTEAVAVPDRRGSPGRER